MAELWTASSTPLDAVDNADLAAPVRGIGVMENPLIIRKHLSPIERGRLDEQVRAGRLTPVLPGAYSADPQPGWWHRVWAAHELRPGSVLSRQTAARLDFWPERLDETVHLDQARFIAPPPWLHVSRRAIPDALVTRRGELRITAAPLTVLDMVDDLGGTAIDEGLRRRVVTLELLARTMEEMTWRRGNALRRRLLHESREQPWSALERSAHQILRHHRISGWKGNHRVNIRGRVFYIDIAFPGLKLAVELDGWSYHRTRQDLEYDANRHNWLQYDGWRVLRFTAATLDELVAWVRRFQRDRMPQQDA